MKNLPHKSERRWSNGGTRKGRRGECEGSDAKLGSDGVATGGGGGGGGDDEGGGGREAPPRRHC